MLRKSYRQTSAPRCLRRYTGFVCVAGADGTSGASQATQSKRFIETARKLGVDETEAGHERAFGKVGSKAPKKKRGPKSKT